MFAVKTYVWNQPSPDPRLNCTMGDPVDRHGFIITITQAYTHKAAIVASTVNHGLTYKLRQEADVKEPEGRCYGTLGR